MAAYFAFCLQVPLKMLSCSSFMLENYPKQGSSHVISRADGLSIWLEVSQHNENYEQAEKKFAPFYRQVEQIVIYWQSESNSLFKDRYFYFIFFNHQIRTSNMLMTAQWLAPFTHSPKTRTLQWLATINCPRVDGYFASCGPLASLPGCNPTFTPRQLG